MTSPTTLMIRTAIVLALLSLVSSAPPFSPKTPSFKYRSFTKPGLIGYWANWGTETQPSNTIDKLDLTNFTSVIYSFVFPTAEGNIIPAWTFEKMTNGALTVKSSSKDDETWIPILNNKVRSKYPRLRTVISIGGWTGSTNFSSIAKNDAYTAKFAKNVRLFMDKNGFDGVDLDWEFPGGGGIDCLESDPNDAANFVKLLSALRKELGPDRHLSIAAGAYAGRYSTQSLNGGQQNYIKEYAKYVNYFGLMTYDIYGSWNAFSDFNSPLGAPNKTSGDPVEPSANNGPQTVKSFLEMWIKLGVPKTQLVTGLAFYGRTMSVVSKGENNGLYQPCKSDNNLKVAEIGTGDFKACDAVYGDFLDAQPPCDTCGVCGGLSAQWMYYSLRGGLLKNQQPNAPLIEYPKIGKEWSYKYFEFAESATLFSDKYQNIQNYFIAYDDTKAIEAKARWAKSAGLGGQMIWELSSDFKGELARAAAAGFLF
ncbi:glycoside hydrolase superfamily [Obelidium mucronatum]|nr:glycoside hydrolase superfamily [Obelidium mucronatum]